MYLFYIGTITPLYGWKNWGLKTVLDAVAKSMVVPQKIECRFAIWSSNSTSENIMKRIESGNLNKYLCTHVHSNIIYKSQKVEATAAPIDGWMGKQNIVYPQGNTTQH